jgi:hypothetical protein
VKLSANQRIDMWGRWKAGQSLHEIGRVFGKDHVSIQFMLAHHGGILWDLRLRPVDFERVLHRPIETAPFLGSWTDDSDQRGLTIRSLLLN